MFNKVLCIDDDNTTLTICKLLIARTSFAGQTITALNGKEGLDYFSQHINDPDALPDIVFLDLNMPVMNGWDFLEEYTTQYAAKLPGMKIVVLSSTVNPADFQKAARFPVIRQFVSKPLSVESLELLKRSLGEQ